MAITKTFAGSSYNLPQDREPKRTWGASTSNFLISLADNAIPKTGGSYTLSAELNLGATYGLLAAWLKSSGSNVSSAGVLRLANTESIGWRNAANSANLALSVNASNLLIFNGNPVVTLALGAADTAFRMNAAGTAYEFAKLVNANIDAAAAITYSKLALTGALVNADVNASAAIAYSKLNLSTSIVNADVNAAAAIDWTKLAVSSTVSSTELGYLDGVTSALQSQLSGKQPLDADLTALAALAGIGLLARTGSSDYATRTLLAGLGISVSNGSGESDDPNIAVDTTVVATTSNTLTMSGKTLTSAVLDDYVDINEESSPTTPSAGKVRVYAKTDKKLYTKDSAGTEAQIGATGSGELNLVENPSDSNNWTSTGWSGAATTTTTAGDLPLGGIVDTAIKITSDSSADTEAAEYVSYAFTTPASLATKLKIEFWMRPGANFVASEWTVSVYQSTTRQALSTDASSVTALPNAAGKFTTTFDCAASTAYTLRFARTVNAAANAGVLNLAGVVVGPGIQPQGAVVAAALAFTPTGTWSTNTTYTGLYSRDGEYANIEWLVTLAGAPTSAALKVNLPTGLTINTAKLVDSSSIAKLDGDGEVLDTGTARYIISSHYSSTSAVELRYHAVTTHSGTAPVLLNSQVTDIAPFTMGSGDKVIARVRVPISEWAGSGTVNLAQNDVEYAYNTSGITTAGASNTTAFGYGPAGAAIGSIDSSTATASFTTLRTRFSTPIQSTDKIDLEISSDSGVTWQIAEARGIGKAVQGTARYGVGINAVSATDVDVAFGNAGGTTANTTYALVGTSWASFTTNRWRVKKSSGGQAVGFGAATATSAGLVSTTAQTLAGAKTFSSISTHSAGIQLAAAASGSPATSTLAYYQEGVEGNLGAISLLAGTWTTIDSKVFSWTRVGNRLDFWFRLESTTAGSGVTGVYFALPSGVPTIVQPSNGGSNEFTYSGSAIGSVAVNGVITPGVSVFYNDAGNIYAQLNTAIAVKFIGGHLVMKC